MQELDSLDYLNKYQVEEGSYQRLDPQSPADFLDEDQYPPLQSYPLVVKDNEPTSDKDDKEPQPSKKCIQPPQAKFTVACQERYRRAFQGTKDDTVELNINFKTLLVQYFRELIYLRELSPPEIEHVEEFAKRVPSFTSLGIFYADKPGNEKVRRLCLQFLQSSDCIRRVLSGRCKMRTKLMMIKFIEKMRVNLFTKTPIKWKEKIPDRSKSLPI